MNGPISLMKNVYRYVLPGVKRELDFWKEEAYKITNEELRTQAIESMMTKRFHCEGGSVYALLHLKKQKQLIALIVALQTISDYLDNLCDRSTSLDPVDFRMLHASMLDAIDPSAELQAYYQYREEQDDAGYLGKLVTTCQNEIRQFPSYEVVYPYVKKLVINYIDLQVHKHIHPKKREQVLYDWCQEHESEYPAILWNEFAAATGSTLGMFMLFVLASFEQTNQADAKLIFDSYFPHVCGLHILLDYLIDQEEDVIGGDLNFCTYYTSEQQTGERIIYFAEQARKDVKGLPQMKFHRMIIEGLLALYLSDPKVKTQANVKKISRELMKGSPMTRMFFWANSVYIRKKQAVME